jgi:amidase
MTESSMTNNPALWSAKRQAAAIRKGDLSSRDLLELYISRIEKYNPGINAVVTTDFDNARQAADAADLAVKNGDELGLLHGLPVTIKDALQTAGIRSTGGAVELKDSVPATDAPVVKAVKDAGAIVMGKTNLPRWSGDIQAYNEIFGTTNNPWDVSRVPGGSSGGAAAAVAAGLTSFEIGTDIGGSIRFPSAFCGVFGHKPSFGIIPSTGYLDHMQGGSTEADVNVLGPITRSAEDLELLLGVLVKKQKPLITDLAPAPDDVAAMRVAAWLDDEFCPVDKDVLDVLNVATGALEKSGVAIDRNARPDIEPNTASMLGMWLVSAAMAQSLPEPGSEAPSLTEGVATHRQWLDFHLARESIRIKWAEFFNHYDAIIMPVCFVPPFLHNQEGDFTTRELECNGETRPYSDLVRWTILTGMAYLPSTVPPIGIGNAGLPIGIQVVGPYGGDYTTIRLAAYLADLCGGFKSPPGY